MEANTPSSHQSAQAHVEAEITRVRANIVKLAQMGIKETKLLVKLLNDEGLATIRTAHPRLVAQVMELNGADPTPANMAAWLMRQEWLELNKAGLLPYDAELDERHIVGMLKRDIYAVHAHAQWQANTPDMEQACLYHADVVRKHLNIKGEGRVSLPEVTTALLNANATWKSLAWVELDEMLATQKAANRARCQESGKTGARPLDTPTR